MPLKFTGFVGGLSLLAVALVVLHLRSNTARPDHAVPGECVLSEDAQRGKVWAPTCKGCHDINPYAPEHPSGGPNLHDIYQSLAGTQSLQYHYEYHSPILAARDAGVVWTDDNLDRYLSGPEAFLRQATGRAFNPLLYMAFFIGGLDDTQVRARHDVIAYFREIKGKSCN